ncbi:hypothetical protein [Streptomyces sp. NPDC008121]|uniref:hypothetical protein n=1 Tax=Streptomyces sp. NPDC008121 TaxID=3364809 RepID=UPI0036E56EDD
MNTTARFSMSPADHAYLDMKVRRHHPLRVSWSAYAPVRRSYEWDPTTATAHTDGTGSMVPARQIAGVED